MTTTSRTLEEDIKGRGAESVPHQVLFRPLFASKHTIPAHKKVIFAANSNKEIASYINSLIYRSFKQHEKQS